MGPRSEAQIRDDEEVRGRVGALRKVPSLRTEGGGASVEDWLRAKEMDDGAEGLWRIHDDLYDFGDFLESHPGGEFWLETTKGTDITEAFESHHVADKAEKLLGKFRVRKATTKRSCLLTFRDDGFFRTLKRKIRKSATVPLSGSTLKSRLLIDSFLLGFLVASFAGVCHGLWWSVAAGAFLYMLGVASHNFFHMRDNFRMYYWNLSLLSFRDWRVSHVLSHHQFANTLLDLEISLFEPFFQYLPKPDKTVVSRFLPWLISPVVFTVMFYAEFFKRNARILLRKRSRVYWDEYLGLAVPLLLWLTTGRDLWTVLTAWNISILSGSFFFTLVGLTAAHHHPDIYHEGDYLGDDKDFGIFQLAAVRDREEVNGNFFFTMISFGEHALHHMFPTLDHGSLAALAPIFEETCREFNIDFKLKTAGSLVTGMYQQLARNYVNERLLLDKIKSC